MLIRTRQWSLSPHWAGSFRAEAVTRFAIERVAKTKFEPAEAPVTPTASPYTWTDEATARLNRVPAGFMRDMTREEVERVAASKNLTLIDLAVAEEGIGHARETMNEVISGYISQKMPR